MPLGERSVTGDRNQGPDAATADGNEAANRYVDAPRHAVGAISSVCMCVAFCKTVKRSLHPPTRCGTAWARTCPVLPPRAVWTRNYRTSALALVPVPVRVRTACQRRRLLLCRPFLVGCVLFASLYHGIGLLMFCLVWAIEGVVNTVGTVAPLFTYVNTASEQLALANRAPIRVTAPQEAKAMSLLYKVCTALTLSAFVSIRFLMIGFVCVVRCTG